MTAFLPVLAALATLLLWPPRVGLPHRFRAERHGTPRSGRAMSADELAWVEALVAELWAGRDPDAALVVASSATSAFPEVAAVARAGGDVVAALRVSARSALSRGVAACWEVAHGSGTGLAASLTVLADAARDTERVRNELRAGVAEPRATAIVLATLPLLGVALGTALGAEPVPWLLGSAPGRVVLAAGLALEVVGAWWSWRITVSLEAAL